MIIINVYVIFNVFAFHVKHYMIIFIIIMIIYACARARACMCTYVHEVKIYS